MAIGKRWLRGGLVVALVAAAALGTQPLLVQWHTGRARQLLRAREYRRAQRELRLAVWLAPDRPESLLLLARMHRRSGDPAPAWALLRQAEKLHGDAERIERERWMLLAQTGQLREAEPHLAELLENPCGDGEEICEAYVQGYFANFRVAEAVGLLDAWAADYPRSPQPPFMRAYLMQAMGLRPEAVAAYRQGLELSPGEPGMQARLAAVLTDMGQLDEAGELLGSCVEHSPDPETAFAWANYLFVRGDLDPAQEAVVAMLERWPGHFDAQRLAGQIELARGQFEGALPHLNAAFRLRPYDPSTRDALGRALRALGRTAEAKPHLDYVVRAERTQGRLDRLFRQIFERPADVQLRYEIGAALLECGSPEDGAKWLQTVLQLQPDHAGAHQALAVYYRARGELAAAQAHWQRAQPKPPIDPKTNE